MRLSFIELMAVMFAGMAGAASAVQAYVSWETRGEVSRAIVFAERIDACANVITAIEPFLAKARRQAREVVAGGAADGRYSLPGYYYGMSAGNAAFDAEHQPRVEAWRAASAAFIIVLPEHVRDRAEFFNTAIAEAIEAGQFMNRDEMLAWLERFETEADALAEDCRGLMDAPSLTDQKGVIFG